MTTTTKIVGSLKDLPVTLAQSGGGSLRVAPGAPFRTKLTITTEGDNAWDWTAEQPLRLAYRWFDEAGNPIVADGPRSLLPKPLRPGSAEVELSGNAPATEGPHRLVVSLLLEHVHWACDVSKRGWTTIPANVAAPPAWPAELETSVGGKALRGALAAAAIERRLAERPFDAAATDQTAPSVAPVEQQAVQPAPGAIRRPKASLGRRIRAWFRHTLGIVEMREAVEELLRRSAAQEQHVQLVRSELSQVVQAGAEHARQIQEIQAAQSAAEAHWATLEAMRADLETLGAELTKQGASIKAIKTQQASAKAQLATLARLRDRLETLKKSLGEHGKTIKAGQAATQAQLSALPALSSGLDAVRKDLKEQGKALKAEQASAQAQLASLPELRSGLDGIRNDLKEQAEALKAEQAQLSALPALREGLEALGDTLDEHGKTMQAQQASTDAQLAMLPRLQDELEALRNHLDGQGKAIAALEAAAADEAAAFQRLHDALGEVDKAFSGLPSQLVVELSGSQAFTNLAAELGELRASVQDPRLLSTIDAIDGALRQLPQDVGSQVAALQDELGEKLGNEVALVRQELGNELRSGPVAVELLSWMRQLAEWAFKAGDLGAVATLAESINAIQSHTSYNSEKLDQLLVRETIALPSAGLVLARNAYGFLAIQDDDVAAIGYYSSGRLPETGTVALIERLLQPGDCFLDVGANVGAYTLLAGRLVGPAGRVIAVEPMPATARALRATVAINGLGSVTEIHQCALGSASGRATIYAGKTSGHSSLLEIDGVVGEPTEVEIKRGSQILKKRKPRLIKIDVEGWELDVLDGLENLSQRIRSDDVALIVECSPIHIRARGLSVEEWLGQVRDLKAKIWIIGEQQLSLCPLRKASQVGDGSANLFISRVCPPALKAVEQQ